MGPKSRKLRTAKSCIEPWANIPGGNKKNGVK